MLPALDVRHLARSYRAGVAGCCASVRVLVDVTFRVRAGEIVGVCGAAGAGKTTLLRCLAAALRPDRGEVRWFGVAARAELRRALGVTFVGRCPAHHAFLTARQSLEHAIARSRPTSDRPALTASVGDLLDRAGLARLAARRVTTLSRGAVARLAVAQALVERPRLLLLDGAFDGCDARWRASLGGLLRRVAAEDGVACVVGARDYVELRGVADRVLVLADGHAGSEARAVGAGANAVRWSVGPSAAAPVVRAARGPRVAERDVTFVGRSAARGTVPSVDSPCRAP